MPSPRDGGAATPALIVVTGAPCTGKTTFARRAADALGLPLAAKDAIKTLLFDTVGWRDREWSRRLDEATYAILRHWAEAALRAGRPIVLESNFKPAAHTSHFHELATRVPCRPFQVFLESEAENVVRWFQERAAAGARHPGHRDDLLVDELPAMLVDGRYAPLPLDGPRERLDYAAADAARREAEIIEAARGFVNG